MRSVIEREAGRSRPGSVDLFVIGTAAWLLVAALPVFFLPSYFPRLAILVAAVPLGVVAIADDVRRRDRLTLALAAVVGWALVSSLASDHPAVALLGATGREASWLILAGAACLFAIGRRVGDSSGDLMVGAVIAALCVNSLVAVAQVVIDADSGLFSLYLGRAHGLLTAHVYLGAVMAGGCGLVVASARRLGWPLAAPLLAVFAATVGLSGARSSLVAAVAGSAVVAVIVLSWREAAAATATVGAGVALGVVVQSAFADAASNAVARVATAGFAGRVDAWGYGVEAALDRPITGWGPSQFRSAVQGRFSETFTDRHASGATGGIWFDSHNVVISVLVALGVVGLALVAWFGVELARSARGPFAAFAVVTAVSWLVQPLSLATLPIVFLALGLAAPCPPHRDLGDAEPAGEAALEPTSAARRDRPLVLVGLCLGLVVLMIDLSLDRAVRDRSSTTVEWAASALSWDPVLAGAAASANAAYDDDLDDAVTWARRAVERESSSVVQRNLLARYLLEAGEVDAALVELGRALELHPYNAEAVALAGLAASMQTDGG